MTYYVYRYHSEHDTTVRVFNSLHAATIAVIDDLTDVGVVEKNLGAQLQRDKYLCDLEGFEDVRIDIYAVGEIEGLK